MKQLPIASSTTMYAMRGVMNSSLQSGVMGTSLQTYYKAG
jgi:hypothetical protein